jgi:hypothetical protein
MLTDRLFRILALLRASDGARLSATGLCDVAVEAVAVTAASVMLMSDDIPRGSGCASTRLSSLIEDLQFTLGEGPCVDAYGLDRPVLEPDLASNGGRRWIAFAAPAVAAGVRATFGFPLRVGTVRLCALNLCNDLPGPLSDDQHADALVMADIVTRTLLAIQAEAPPGAIAIDLEEGSDFRGVVHQASGMVSAQMNIRIAEALARLRAFAFATDRLLMAVSEDVVTRRLRLG